MTSVVSASAIVVALEPDAPRHAESGELFHFVHYLPAYQQLSNWVIDRWRMSFLAGVGHSNLEKVRQRQTGGSQSISEKFDRSR